MKKVVDTAKGLFSGENPAGSAAAYAGVHEL